MKQMKRITLRLSLENPSDKKIADFLANIDKNKYHTVNNAIKTILFSVINGNTTEKSEKSDMKEIISVIRTTLEAEIPKLLSVFSSSNHTKIEQDNTPVEKSADTLDDDDIDMDFIGG
ncbi:hypothetical protein [Huintestinicola sp.]|uniref:hypothetical protein n=1 Tax=Huintestinicola sp. TaxID=2981661 RepID=UPI003D7EE861